MSRRFVADSLIAPPPQYRLLPFNFTRWGDDRLLVNVVGDFAFLSESAFGAFVNHELDSSTHEYAELKSKHFLTDSASRVPYESLATRYRTKKAFLAGFTKLHIFVVSLRCEHSCHYCQVSRVSSDRVRYDMSPEMAEKALDLVFKSPSPSMKIELQGGEPLLNFPLVQQVIESASRRAQASARDVEFVVTTNLALLDDAMLRFFKDHRVRISTSLDGPADLHNANRPRPGNDSHEATVRGIAAVREALGCDSVSAVMTTTRRSLNRANDIIDEYGSAFLRSFCGRSVHTVSQ